MNYFVLSNSGGHKERVIFCYQNFVGTIFVVPFFSGTMSAHARARAHTHTHRHQTRHVWGQEDIYLKVSVRASTAGAEAAGFTTWKKNSNMVQVSLFIGKNENHCSFALYRTNWLKSCVCVCVWLCVIHTHTHALTRTHTHAHAHTRTRTHMVHLVLFLLCFHLLPETLGNRRYNLPQFSSILVLI